jgi:pSer/pThr/pTyr-binding forkhead associated (FHA) protein
MSESKPNLQPELEQFPSVRRIMRWLTSPDSADFKTGSVDAGNSSSAIDSRPPSGGVPSGANWDADFDDLGPIEKSGPFSTSAAEHEFRPTMRPPVPILTVLDDGSQDAGEEHRMRAETVSIGRTAGTIVIPNDISMSGSHAEIRRTPWKGGWQWHLHDVGSVNGTYARCVRAILHENAILILGARRFRLRNPLVPTAVDLPGGETRVSDGRDIPSTVWPTLAEASSKPDALKFPIRLDEVVIGRVGSGADIELDDPLLASRHAVLRRQRDGTWQIISEQTKNGIWVSISAVALSSHCFFRCGEQRFRFVIP